jgi:hypothetical protein
MEKNGMEWVLLSMFVDLGSMPVTKKGHFKLDTTVLKLKS